jgi:hypothetical protein
VVASKRQKAPGLFGPEVPAAAWFRDLAEQTRAFSVQRVQQGISSHRPGGPSGVWDYVITTPPLRDGHPVRFCVKTRTQVTPQIALGLLAKMRADAGDGVPVLCSPSISPRVAELCWEHGVGYLDEAGNCRIAAPGLYIQVTGRRNTRPDTRPLNDPFSKKSSRIVRVLLADPGRGWQVQELAEEAEVSLGLASKVKGALVREAFVEERNRQVHVRDAAALLEAWRQRYKVQAEALPLYAMARPQETEERVAAWCRANGVPYALTQLAGAWRVAPAVRYERSTVYLAGDLEPDALAALLRAADAKAVESGANLSLWVTPDRSVFYRQRVVDGINVVSPLQLYLDLQSVAGRGNEAAREIFEREIRPVFADTPRAGRRPEE